MHSDTPFSAANVYIHLISGAAAWPLSDFLTVFGTNAAKPLSTGPGAVRAQPVCFATPKGST